MMTSISQELATRGQLVGQRHLRLEQHEHNWGIPFRKVDPVRWAGAREWRRMVCLGCKVTILSSILIIIDHRASSEYIHIIIIVTGLRSEWFELLGIPGVRPSHFYINYMKYLVESFPQQRRVRSTSTMVQWPVHYKLKPLDSLSA